MKFLYFSLLFLMIQIVIIFPNYGQLPGNHLKLWLSPDTGIVLNGNTVAQWLDQSGNNHNALQLLAPCQPLFLDSTLNSLPVVGFDGINDYLQLNFGSTLPQPITIFCLWNTISAGNTKTAFDGINANDRLLLSILNNDIRVFSGVNLSYPKIQPFGFILTTVVFQQNNTLIFENGVLKSNGNSGNNSLSGLTLGSYFDGTFSLHGQMAEFIIYDTILPVNERLQVENYILDKYAPPLNLGPDEMIGYGFCPVSIGVSPTFVSVLWSTGSTSDTISISESGIFWAEATDIFGRTSYDTISIEFPVFDILDTLVCLGDSLIVSVGLGQDYSYLWSTNDTSQQITVFSQGMYSVTVTDSSGCFRFDTFEVTVDHFSSVVSLGNDTVLCSGNIIALISDQNEAIGYQWHPGYQTTSEIIVDTSGWYSVEVTNINNCHSKDSLFVSISGTAPSIGFEFQNQCFGDLTIFSDLSTPQASIAQQIWVFNMTDTLFGQNVQYMFPDTGIHYVNHIVADTGGCKADTVFSVHIMPVPQVFFSGNPPCTGLPVVFSGSATLPQGTTVNQFQWNINGVLSGNDSTLTWLFPSAGNNILTYYVSLDNGCSATFQSDISVNDSYSLPISPELNFPVNNIIVSDLDVQFSWDSSPDAINYRILVALDNNFSSIIADVDSITSTSIQLGLPSNGMYYWRIQTCNPCKICSESDIDQFVIFSPASLPNLILWLKADTGIGLNGNTVEQWIDQSGNNYNASQLQTSRQPILVDSALNALPVVRFDGINDFLQLSFGNTFSQPITIFCLWNTLSAGNTKTAFDGINVNERLLISTLSDQVRIFAGINLTYPDTHPFSFTLNTAVFNNTNSVIFKNSLQQMNGNVGNNSISGVTLGSYFEGSFPLHGDIAEIILFNSLFTNTERMQVENYLMDKYASPVYLGNDIISDYSFCPIRLGVRTDFSSVLWSTGSTADTITVSQTGNYWVQVVDVFGRLSSDTVYVQIPDFLLTDTIICFGDTAMYHNTFQGTYSYLWSDLSTEPVFKTTQLGTYWLQLTDTTGCSRTDTFTVNMDYFSIEASLGPDLSICRGDSIALIQGTQSAVNYIWSTSETTSSIIPQLQEPYSVTVINSTGCIARDTINISFHGIKPTAGFLTDSVCFGFQTTFSDTSSAVAPDVISGWQWIIGGTQSNIQNPQFQFNTQGFHQVQLTVQTLAGCSATVINPVFVFANPQSDFQPIKGCSQQSIQFSNQTTLLNGTIDSYAWLSFDENQNQIHSSGQIHPVFSFGQQGLYDVVLIAVTQTGCMDTTIKSVEIRQSPPVDFVWSNTCIGQTTAFTETTQVPSHEYIMLRNWGVGDNSSSALPNPQHMFTETGIFDVTLYNKSINGCEASLTKQVEIHPLPVAGFFSSIPCQNTPVEFTDTSTVENGSIESVFWTFPGGDTTSLLQPVYIFPDTGTYSIQLTAISNVGCSGSVTKLVAVYPVPLASFTFSPEYGIPPLEVSFFNTSSGADEYIWYFGDGFTSAFPNPVHTYTQTNVYDVELIAQNTFLCSNSIVGTVYVIPSSFDISMIQTEQTINGSIMQSSVLIKNIGTRIIRTLKMKVQLDQGIPVTELWEGSLFPGEETWFSFNSVFETEQLVNRKIICYSALPNEDTEDVQPENNTICSVLKQGFYIISVTPNPAQNSIVINFILNENTIFNFELISAEGKKVIQKNNIEGNEGFNTFQVDVSIIEQGIYLMKLFNNNEQQYHRIVITR